MSFEVSWIISEFMNLTYEVIGFSQVIIPNGDFQRLSWQLRERDLIEELLYGEGGGKEKEEEEEQVEVTLDGWS